MNRKLTLREKTVVIIFVKIKKNNVFGITFRTTNQCILLESFEE